MDRGPSRVSLEPTISTRPMHHLWIDVLPDVLIIRNICSAPSPCLDAGVSELLGVIIRVRHHQVFVPRQPFVRVLNRVGRALRSHLVEVTIYLVAYIAQELCFVQ